jgi:UDP-glucose 4-epimerase
MNKVLITGASGFIGKYLLELAKKNNDYSEIYTISRRKVELEKYTKHKIHFCMDLSIQSEVEWLFQQINPDIIFHLAGNPIVKVDEKNINGTFRDNINTTHNLVHFCPNGCRFILASTILVYGDMAKVECPIDENTCTLPTSMYGLSKLTAEHIINIHTIRGNIKGTSARLCANVGEIATHGVLKDFIEKAKSNSEYFDIIGDKPGSTKPYMYVGDTACALMTIAKNEKPILSLNVSNNDVLSSEQIAQIVQEECGTNKPVRWLGEKANWVGDNKLLVINNNYLNQIFKISYSSEMAIRRVVRNSL